MQTNFPLWAHNTERCLVYNFPIFCLVKHSSSNRPVIRFNSVKTEVEPIFFSNTISIHPSTIHSRLTPTTLRYHHVMSDYYYLKLIFKVLDSTRAKESNLILEEKQPHKSCSRIHITIPSHWIHNYENYEMMLCDVVHNENKWKEPNKKSQSTAIRLTSIQRIHKKRWLKFN